MYIADAKCKKCKHIWEITKKRIMDNWVSGNCPECGSKKTIKMPPGLKHFEMAEGNVGNSKTGYSDSVTYKPSSMGKFKGSKVK
jgi:hypothetical protein